MSEIAQWGLIGRGNIGNEIMRQLGQEHVAGRLGLSPVPAFVVRLAGVFAADGSTPYGVNDVSEIDNYPEVTFVATPSTDDGEAAYSYISHALGRGKLVVTAEKGALANNFASLRAESNSFERLGYNATVGGGTRIIEIAKTYCDDVDNITQIHLALNGTLSAIFSLVAPPQGSGMSLGQAVGQAVKLGYAEPGTAKAYHVIRQEAEGDIPKKTAILINSLGLSDEALDWTQLKFELQDEVIAQAIEEARVRRFIVSIFSEKHLENSGIRPDNDVLGGFNISHGGWRVVGGFKHIERNPLFSPLASLTGPGNGVVVGLGPNESDGVYTLVGPGAGVSPTVNTMIDDYVARKKVAELN